MSPLRTSSAATALALPWAAWAAVRATGADRGFPVTPALALTPYAAASSLLPLAAAVATRSRPATALAAASAALLGGTVLQRVRRRPAAGPTASRPLRLVSLNMLHGRADPAATRDLVAATDADVLALMEVTPEAVTALLDAGIADLLPEAHVVPAGEGQPAGAGGAMWTRLEVASRTVLPGRFGQPVARLVLPGAPDVEVTAVHTHPPARSSEHVRRWTEELALLGEPDDDVLRVLAGDFNATVDHAAFRRLLGTGWVDAAQATGQSWRATWQPEGLPEPRLTLDHVLADPRVGVRSFGVVRVPGSDHRALVTELRVPLTGPVEV
ncbi:endonuclease/exonuclease/phosphatase family protein [Modestobacter sp. NPDC049651]|uniref:endonuclease/exonuclease/phosphatase family protein n=1 Tax=unclassified Modestobacter TaxID=2643866 RepID=UPI0033E38F48